ncbi:MAG: radical SAM protein [Crenarchaeota archaeon]|nr:radical SAM protein [Thermoproteota archaeon]
MIPLSVMVTGEGTVSVKIKGRYGPGRPSRFTDILRPIIFWNITYQCNLRCSHCYIRAMAERAPAELDTGEARGLVEQLVGMRIPLLLLSGGEPLVREDIWDILEPAKGKPLPKLALSTNGTLIDRDTAERLKEYGFTYIGISIDSLNPEWHDKFRGVKGAFEAALRGIKNSLDAGLDVGLRTTITRYNAHEAPDIVDWCVKQGIPRLSLYILDTVGRGEGLKDWLPSHEQLRSMVDSLIEAARRNKGRIEIQLVRANFLGIYLADKLAKTPEEFRQYMEMLEAQGDCGRKSASIYPDGSVKPCQFVDWVTIGNVREKPLREILRPDNPQLKPFLAIHRNLRGPRCSKCPFRRICGGGSRSRAKILTGDPWGDDPLCIIEDPVALAEKWGFHDPELEQEECRG